jgi:hypothetical protein
VIIMAASLSSAGGASLVAVWNLPQAVWALLTCCKSCDEEERRLSLQRRSSGRPTSSSQRLLAGPAAPGQWDDLEAAAANRAAAARVILNTGQSGPTAEPVQRVDAACESASAPEPQPPAVVLLSDAERADWMDVALMAARARQHDGVQQNISFAHLVAPSFSSGRASGPAVVQQPPLPAVTVLGAQECGLDESREVGSTASEVRPESATLTQLATAESQRVEARDYENASKLYTQSSLIQELRQQIEAKECDEREAVAQRQYAIAEQHDTERRALEGQMAAAIQDAQRLARRAAGEEVALSDDS